VTWTVGTLPAGVVITRSLASNPVTGRANVTVNRTGPFSTGFGCPAAGAIATPVLEIRVRYRSVVAAETTGVRVPRNGMNVTLSVTGLPRPVGLAVGWNGPLGPHQLFGARIPCEELVASAPVSLPTTLLNSARNTDGSSAATPTVSPSALPVTRFPIRVTLASLPESS
jgi:hypothetical protein